MTFFVISGNAFLYCFRVRPRPPWGVPSPLKMDHDIYQKCNQNIETGSWLVPQTQSKRLPKHQWFVLYKCLTMVICSHDIFKINPTSIQNQTKHEGLISNATFLRFVTNLGAPGGLTNQLSAPIFYSFQSASGPKPRHGAPREAQATFRKQTACTIALKLELQQPL